MAQRNFNDIYLGLQDRIYRLAAGIVGGREEAEDLVQDLYERLWTKRDFVAGQPNPEGYILASARNLSLDLLRKRRPQGELSPLIAAEGARPDEGDMEEIVARLVAALPEKQRTALRLRDVECMEMDEIAAVMEMRATAVRMTLSRARGTVKERLEKIMNFSTI
ncbi:MAG: RNA polymerase sigma factor [Alistipes sp.]|jgi:RNA polymerase sigma-70 factor (ECF subfamily)|nr:RNA polymerase sigma factor [Alistipes sp.]